MLRAGHGDPGTIQLNHYRHLQPNLLGPNGSHVQMVCTDCHRSAADANGPWPYGDPQSQSGAAKTAPANGKTRCACLRAGLHGARNLRANVRCVPFAAIR